MSNENPNIVVGLDIGTTKIACFVGERAEGGKVRILGYAKMPSIGVERGIVKNIKSAAQTIDVVVEQASERSGYEIREVYVGIAGQHIKSYTHQGAVMIAQDKEFIDEEDVDRLIKEQSNIALGPGEEIIHIFPQTYYVDDEELTGDISPIGVNGKQLRANFHIVTGNTMNLMNIRNAVQRAGLKIKGVVLEPIASALAVLDETDKQAGVALVDIGGGTTDIAIFHEGIIRHTSVLPLAGNVITNDIKENCMIQKPQAELLKTHYGSCLPDQVSENDIISIPSIRQQPPKEIGMRLLATIIKQRTQMILEQVNYEIQKSKLDKCLIGGIVLTGGGAQLHHIKEYTEFITTIDTRIGYPDEHLVGETEKELVDTMYSTGIGLVIYGLDKEENEARRVAESQVEAPEPEAPEPVKEPANTGFSAFGDLEELKAEPPVEKEPEPRETPAKPKKKDKKKGDDKRGKPNWIHSFENYVNRMFNDGTISNEGEEDNDLN